jgi:hypothetical protein
MSNHHVRLKRSPSHKDPFLATLHVAAALELKAQHFWTFDDCQAKLAKVFGLKLS